MSDFDGDLANAARSGRDAARPAPAADIRRVGARMRRIRTATAATLSAAAIAGVIGIVSTTTSTEAIPDVADTTTPSESPTTPAQSPTAPPGSPSPSTPTPTSTTPPPPPPTTPVEPVLEGNLLRASDLDPLPSGDGVWQWVELDGAVPRCTPEVSAAAVETAAVRYGVVERQVYMTIQRAEAYATAVDAAARLAELRAGIGQCAEQAADVNLFAAFTLSGVGDGGFIVETVEPEEGLLDLPLDGTPDSSLFATTRFAQTGRVVTWTAWTVSKAEYLSYPEVAELAAAVDRLCGPADGACTGDDAALTITYPTELAGTEVEPGGFSDLI